MSCSRFKLLVAGVGGQGVLTVARLIGDAALRGGLEVVVGQLHGMSQRGGSVEATVLLGPGRGSFIAAGEADVVLAFEPIEALRALPKMSDRTLVLLSTGRVNPPLLSLRGESYPELDRIVAEISAVAGEVVCVDGPALVATAGAPGALNTAMLGVLAGREVLPLDRDALLEALERRTRPAHLEANRRAFLLGCGERLAASNQ